MSIGRLTSTARVQVTRSAGISSGSVFDRSVSRAVTTRTSTLRRIRYLASLPTRIAPIVLDGGKYQDRISTFIASAPSGSSAGVPGREAVA
jgi:hypothetical protein